jgi:peptidoglycan/xylan/chitin deacetylase (PgdA/CDA1 family)
MNPTSLLQPFLTSLTWSIKTAEKVIYLTFDDGPEPMVTPEALDLLKEHHAKATFFCLGKNVEKHPNIFKQIIDEGHAVGNHGYEHLNGWKTRNFAYMRNVLKGDQFVNSPLYRPPYGRIKLSQKQDLAKKYKVVMWDVLCKDYRPSYSAVQCFSRVQKKTKKGSIVVFHDSPKAKDNMLYTLSRTLKHFGKMGYDFKVLTPELLGKQK